MLKSIKKLWPWGALLLAAIGVLAFLTISREKNVSYIDLVVVPSGSSVKLDGKGVKSGLLAVAPGNHKIIVSRPGFSTQTENISLELKEQRFVGIGLLPNSPETRSWYRDHPDEQLILESISSRSFDQFSEDIVKKVPLVAELPFIDQLYRIDYGASRQQPSNPSAVAIYVKYYSQSGKQQAIDWIKFKGYDPANLEIIYEKAD